MRKFAPYALVLLSLLLVACLPDTSKPLPTAMVVLDPVGSSFVRGSITFGHEDGATRIFVDVTGLTSEHGLHIMTERDCRSAIADVRDGHFNPEGKPHGQHVGDLPNLRADVYGTMHEALYGPNLELTGKDKDSVIGHALILTSRYDDYKTQPDGNSGQAIACGVIQPI